MFTNQLFTLFASESAHVPTLSCECEKASDISEKNHCSKSDNSVHVEMHGFINFHCWLFNLHSSLLDKRVENVGADDCIYLS